MKEISTYYKWRIELHFLLTLALLSGMIYVGLPNLQHFGVVFAQVALIVFVTAYRGTQGRNLVNSPITIVALVLMSFLFPISNSIRWGILLAYSCLILLFDQEKRRNLSLISVVRILNFSLISILFTELLKKVSNYNLQLFSFGYDNAFHFAMFRYFRSSTWFPFGLESKWETDFGMFLTYPTGQAAIWSFLAEPLIGNSVNPSASLAAYSLILAVCLFIMVYLVFRLLKPTSGGFISISLIPIILSVLINVAFSFVLFTNGFLPYFFGLLCLMVFIESYKHYKSSFSRIISFALMAFILVLISPSVLAFILLPSAIIIALEIKKMLSLKQYVPIVISIIIGLFILLIILYIQQRTTATYGWRQILAPGGARQPSIVQVAVVFSGYLVVIVLQRKKLVKDLLLLVSVSGLISVGVLISLTVLYTGSIQYYAVKQVYVALAIISIVLCKYLLHKKIVIGCRAVLILFTSLVLALPQIVPRALNSSFMGAVTGVAIHTLRQGNWSTEVVDANRISATLTAKSHEARNDSACLIFRIIPFDSDLNSRWLNSLTWRPNISNDCFAGFWNSSALTEDQLVEKLGNLPGTFVIVIDSLQNIQLPSILPRNVSTMDVGHALSGKLHSGFSEKLEIG